MSPTLTCCRCCYSAETLEILSGSALDVYTLICDHETKKDSHNRIVACFRCREFLEDVHRFRIDRYAVDEDVDVKPHNVSSQIDIKTEKVDDYDEIDEIDVKLNKVEVVYEPETSEQASEISPERLSVLNIEKSDKPYKCSECSYSTVHLSNLKVHIASKHTDKKPFSCDQCSYRCKRKAHLNQHKMTHSKDYSKPYKCNQCSHETTTMNKLKIHVASKHSEERPFACDQCDYRAKLKGSLIIHKRNHSIDSDKSYKCNECSYEAITTTRLKCHIVSKHCDKRPFPCDQCDSSFKFKYMLEAHKKIHLNDQDKPYKCSECSHTTTSLSNLKVHIASKHSDEKPFSCDQCDYRSKLKGSLVIHKRNHLNDCNKPYECSECSYKTTTLTKLKSHITCKHSDERPFSCDQCNYRSKLKSQLVAHKKTHLKDREKSEFSFADIMK